MGKRPPLIIGNWKMFGRVADLGEALAVGEGLARAGGRVEAALCPPFPLLGLFAAPAAAAGLPLGAQDVDARAEGAFTGCVSAGMLADLGARYVIVGHCERRRDFAETDALVRAKAEAALAAGLTPVVCVGETAAERAAGAAADIVVGQAEASLPAAGREGCVLAYEPVWAIGAGRTPTASEIAEMHAALGAAAPGVRRLYGGSVKPENAAGLFAIPGVEGALVGGASLKAADFLAILRAHPAFAAS